MKDFIANVVTTGAFLFLAAFSWLSLADEAGSYISDVGTQANLKGLERIQQTLVAPPFLPKHQQQYTGKPRIVEVEMVIEEKEIEIEPGTFVQAMTFNGTNPGPMMVVHEGDYVELT
jgi:nitrite reductase (NO-forming)